MVTSGLARLAGAGIDRAVLLGLAMLCLQASIGSLNDMADLERDRGQKPGKPLPRGVVSIGAARLVTGGGLLVGLALWLAGGPATFGVGILGLGIGYAYDLRLKASPWSWLPFALGLPLLPIYAWLGATGTIPPAFFVLVPLAVGGGAALALANELADDERDRDTGIRTAVGLLGRKRAWRVGASLQAVVAGVGAGSLIGVGAPTLAIGTAAGSVALLMIGLSLGRNQRAQIRERGWEAQAIALGGLALAWLGGLASRGLL